MATAIATAGKVAGEGSMGRGEARGQRPSERELGVRANTTPMARARGREDEGKGEGEDKNSNTRNGPFEFPS